MIKTIWKFDQTKQNTNTNFSLQIEAETYRWSKTQSNILYASKSLSWKQWELKIDFRCQYVDEKSCMYMIFDIETL